MLYIQRLADADRVCGHGAHPRVRAQAHRPHRRLLHGAADGIGRSRGLCRGDGQRSEGRQGLLPRGAEQGGASTASTTRSARKAPRAPTACANMLGADHERTSAIVLYVIIAVVGGTLAASPARRTSSLSGMAAQHQHHRILPHARSCSLQTPIIADLQPVQRHRHGAGRRRAHLRVSWTQSRRRTTAM